MKLLFSSLIHIVYISHPVSLSEILTGNIMSIPTESHTAYNPTVSDRVSKYN